MRLKRNEKMLTAALATKQYESMINVDIIHRIPKRRIKSIFKYEDKDVKEIILHNILDKWIQKQDLKDDVLFKEIKRLIRKTGIKLNDIEKNSLRIIEERAFSLERHIKKIDVAENLMPKEVVGVKFTNAKMYLKTKTELTPIFDGDLTISNFRIMMNNSKEENQVMSFNIDEIKDYHYKKYGFEFTTLSRDTFVLRIHDQITLNNTIDNIIKKKIKSLIKDKG